MSMFSQLSETWRVRIIVIVAIVGLFFVIYFKDKLSDIYHNYRKQEFDSQMQADAKKISDLQSTNDQLRGQVKQDLASGQALQIQIDGLTSQLEQFGKAGKAAVQAQQEAQDKYAKDQQDIISSTDSPYDQCVATCTKFASYSAAYACKPSVQQYCQQSTGK